MFAWIPLVAQGQEYRDITEGDSVSLPGDLFYSKQHRLQWWYFTGHLFDESGREFGYELTFFSVGIQKRKYASRFGTNSIYISHFAISDVKRKRYYFSDDTDTGAFGFAGAREDRLNVWVGDDSVEGTKDKMHITASAENMWISLSVEAKKPFVLNGEAGYSRKSEESPLISSLYFSSTNLTTTGTLKIQDTVFRVKGKSWFDREISSRALGRNYQGWDWFAIQLDDDREVMLYLIRKGDGSNDDFSSGTIVYEDGRFRHLRRSDFKVSVKRHYISKKTGARYPSEWEIAIPSEKIYVTIVPLIEEQEFIGTYSTWNYYWEGACRVEGSIAGRAYVEMTGY
jgi:predicted secreted hydrolase